MKKLALIYFLVLSKSLAAAEAPQIKYQVESLFPMYFYQGAHLAAGLRMNDYRVRVSCVDGGDYEYEPKDDKFERNLGTGCGIFAGYFLDARWHVYLFVEKQSYIVTKRSSKTSAKFNIIDIGPGIGYQYFFHKDFYIQPALHVYWRPAEEKIIDNERYELREWDASPTIRVGMQF